MTDEDQRIVRRELQAKNRCGIRPQAMLEAHNTEAFCLWCVTYFPHLVPEIEDWQVESIDAMANEDRVLVMWPAGTGKTTLFSVLFPLWLELIDPDLEQLGVFKDDNEAKDALRVIKSEIENNDELVADFGPLKPAYGKGKWDSHRIDFAKRTRRGKQSSLMYFPYGGQVLGQRSHRRFFDDIVTRDIAFSPEQTRKQIQWFTVDFESGPYAPKDKASYKPDFDQIAGAMTRMAPKDLGWYLETRVTDEEAKQNTHIRRFQVFVVDLIKDEAKHETITPRWPWHMAMAKRAEMGPVAFAMRYRNKVMDDEAILFKEVYMYGSEYNGVKYAGVTDDSLTMDEVIKPGDRVVIGYDPQSGSETRWAADCGIVMLAMDENGQSLRLCDWYRGKNEILSEADSDSQISILLRMAKRCNNYGIIPVIVLEGNQIQRSYRSIILDKARHDGVEVKVDVFFTTSSKWDKEAGVEACVIDFENANLRVPWKLPSDQEHFRGFLESMMEYGLSKFYDIPMAYWFARSYLKNRKVQAMATTIKVEQPTYPSRMVDAMRRHGVIGTWKVVNAYRDREVATQRVK